MLERAGAEKSKNVLLRLDLAEVYDMLDTLEGHRHAARIYKAAIAEFPDHPAIEQVWLRLAFACGHIGDHECEQDSYMKVLRLETEEILRATPTLNLAETQMHNGDLKEAIDGYREALRIAARVPAGETAPLATWGLAVALDRAGERQEADKEARFALELERSMGLHNLLRITHVFFVPAYEVNWYEGLGAAAVAATTTSPRDATKLWARAVHSFSEYVAAGERNDDRWLPIAKAHLARAKAERDRTEKAAARLPPAPKAFEGDVTF
jgi:tetratricopeptide (TPR) repeat protein